MHEASFKTHKYEQNNEIMLFKVFYIQYDTLAYNTI